MTKAKDQPLAAKADTTTDQVGKDGDVSRTEHAMGARQPDDGTYDAQRRQAPLAGRDVPQKIVTAENDTPTPGETNEKPAGPNVLDSDKGERV